MASITTKVGDRGTTRLLSGETVPKDHPRTETYGAVDELESHLGVARTFAGPEAAGIILAIQEDLFAAAAELSAATPEARARLRRRIGPEDTSRLERTMEDLVARFGLPKGFVTPGASTPGAALHVARAVARRAERRVVSLNREAGGLDDLVVYMNRLSDLLFVLAWTEDVREALGRVLDDLLGKKGGAP